jgi:methyl-accepting chemotaxis protein
LLTPIVLLGGALILTVVVAVGLGGQVASAYRRAGLADREMVLASEVRSLSRAIQRDTLKMILSHDAAEQQTLNESTRTRTGELTSKAHDLIAILEPTDAAILADFEGLQHQVMSATRDVKDLALRGDPNAFALMRSAVKPAEKAASKTTDAFIDAKERDIAALTARGGAHQRHGTGHRDRDGRPGPARLRPHRRADRHLERGAAGCAPGRGCGSGRRRSPRHARLGHKSRR